MICLGIKICKMASDLAKKSVDYIFEAKIWLHYSAHFSVLGLLLTKKKCYHVIIMCGCNNSFSSRVGNLPLLRKKA